MFNLKRLAKYLATGVMPEMTALDESLAEHDKKYHPDGYKDGDRCNKREEMSKEDLSDTSVYENKLKGMGDREAWVRAGLELKISPDEKITREYIGGGDCDFKIGDKIQDRFNDFLYESSYGCPRLDELRYGIWHDDTGKWKITSGLDKIQSILDLAAEYEDPDLLKSHLAVRLKAIEARKDDYNKYLSGGHSYGKVKCSHDQWKNLLLLGYKPARVFETIHPDPKSPWFSTDWENVIEVDDTIFYEEGNDPTTTTNHIIAEWD